MSAWQPIETAPIGEDVMLHSPYADQPVYVGHRFREGADEEWYPQHETTFHGGFFEVEFTHWMPLPDAPPAAPKPTRERPGSAA